MIFTSLNENEIIFNEADNKSKPKTKTREDILRDAGRLIKQELGPSTAENATYRLDKDYSRSDFITGKCEFVTVVHIKKSNEMYIGSQYDNAKSMLNILTNVCNDVNKKLPSGCEVKAKYKGDPNTDNWDGWDINLTVPAGKNEFISESYMGGDNMFLSERGYYGGAPDTEIVPNGKGQYDVFYKGEDIATVDTVQDGKDHVKEYLQDHNESTVEEFVYTNNGGSYMHDALYESYIESKIDSENRLAYALKENMVISEADYSNIRALQEAKLIDKVKSTWKRFIAFIKGLVSRFMESMSNILLDEKEYLEKYKDIILKKKPKEDLEYSYTGNYKKGIDRLINTEVPLFDYYKYKKSLEAEGEGALVEAIMQGKPFNYDDGETLSEQFKSYFLALEDGQQEGKFSNLNMTDLYNFCYNFNKIKGIVDKDIDRLESSTRAIESAINKELNAAGNDAAGDKVEGTETNTTTKTEESAVLKEADGEAKSTGLKIEDKPSSDPSSKMQSTQNRDSEAEKDSATAGAAVAKSSGKEADDISKAANKWIEVCRPLIAAKLTACQQIAKDYMAIIRAHVRSYGGSDKKSKEGDKGKDTGSKYSKHSDVAKAQRDAEDAKKEANKAGEEAKK